MHGFFIEIGLYAVEVVWGISVGFLECKMVVARPHKKQNKKNPNKTTLQSDFKVANLIQMCLN